MSDQTQPTPPVEPVRNAEEWIAQINEACGYSAGWAIKTGDLLLQAKQQLPHGQWLAMWASRRMKFGLRTGEMLMRVARHPDLRNSQHFSSLPAAWSILYVLSQLPPEVVPQGIADGVIHPELKLAEARRLLSQSRAGVVAAPAAATAPSFDVTRQKSRVLRSLRQQSVRWPTEHRWELAQLLETIALELRQGGSEA